MDTTVTTGNEDRVWGGGNRPMNASYGKLMMWFFIVSDALTFSGFLAAYGFSRFKFIETWPIADEVFTHVPFFHGNYPMYYVAFMTFILIMSSVTMVLAVDAGGHRVALVVDKEIPQAAEGPQIGRREQHRAARSEHPPGLPEERLPRAEVEGALDGDHLVHAGGLDGHVRRRALAQVEHAAASLCDRIGAQARQGDPDEIDQVVRGEGHRERPEPVDLHRPVAEHREADQGR